MKGKKFKKYTIEIRNQTLSQELTSNSESEAEYHKDGWMEPDEEGVLRLENRLKEETSSPSGLFHW